MRTLVEKYETILITCSYHTTSIDLTHICERNIILPITTCQTGS